MLSLLQLLTFKFFPWITCAVFIIGMSFKIAKWLSGKPEPPVMASKGAMAKSVLRSIILDLILQYRLLRSDFKLWLIVWPMMISLLPLVYFHLTIFLTWLPILPTYALVVTSIVFIVELFLLMLRQLVLRPARSITSSRDHFALLLLLIVALLGAITGLAPRVHEPLALTIASEFVIKLAETPPIWLLVAYAFLAQILLMIVPFTKLINPLTSVITSIFYGIREAELSRSR